MSAVEASERTAVADCRICGAHLYVGDTAYAEDWKRWNTSGKVVGFVWETRYVCERCDRRG